MKFKEKQAINRAKQNPGKGFNYKITYPTHGYVVINEKLFSTIEGKIFEEVKENK